jgi:hypothetical protein
MSIRYPVIISDTGGAIGILVVLVVPVVCLKMAEGNPVCLSLDTWVMCDSFFDSMFMVTFETYTKGHPLLAISKLVPHSIPCVLSMEDVLLVGLVNDSLWVSGVVCIERLHVIEVT